MKLLLLFFLFPIFIFSETINIVPPSLNNMNNYENIRKENTTINNNNNNNNNNNVEPTIIQNQIKTEKLKAIKKNNNVLLNKKQSQIITNSIKQKKTISNINKNNIKTLYSNTIMSDIIDNNNKIDECSLNLNYIYKKIKNRGYQIGLKNSKWEFEKWLKKMKPFLDYLFDIKNYYIQGILEPPMINFEKNTKIKNNGKTYIKKEGEYTIIKKARFKIPLTWEDFLLSDSLKTPDYTVNMSYYKNNKKCKINQSILNKSFLDGYEEGRKETLIIYGNRLDQLSEYMTKLYRYQYLYLTRKIRPPVITPLITPIKTDKKNTNLIISEEEYTIVKPAEFNVIMKRWKNILVENKQFLTKNKRVILK